MWLALFLALAVSAPDKNEAEQLFQKMEASLDKAKTLDLAFETTYGEAALRNGQRLKGTLAVADENKLCLRVRGGKANATVHLRISDGARAIRKVEGDEGKPEPDKTPKNLTANYLTVVARSGVLPALLPQVYANERNDYKEMFPVSGFKLGNKEKVGEREAQRVDYVLGVKGQKTTYPVTVWIDLKTGLPAKRLVSDGGLPWFTETYELTLDFIGNKEYVSFYGDLLRTPGRSATVPGSHWPDGPGI
jgi:hypothetical protein